MGDRSLTTQHPPLSFSPRQAAVERDRERVQGKVKSGECLGGDSGTCAGERKRKRTPAGFRPKNISRHPPRRAGCARCAGCLLSAVGKDREGIMPVDALIDRLASLTLRSGPALQEGIPEKLEYKEEGEVLRTQLPLCLFEQQFARSGSSLHLCSLV